MRRPTFPWSILLSLAWVIPLPAQQVSITGVEGPVLYGAGNSQPSVPIKAGQKLGPGTFSLGSAGLLYLNAFDGSEMRLSESGTLHYDGDDDRCSLEGSGHGLRSNFHLLQGKLLVTVRIVPHPPHCYRVTLPKISASLAEGQCVICMHANEAFLFVARGKTTVIERPSGEKSPMQKVRADDAMYGALPADEKPNASTMGDRTRVLVSDGKVGVASAEGNLNVVPLSALAAATQTCLLADFNPDNGDGGGKKSTGPDAGIPPGPVLPVRPPIRIIVSPTQ